MKWPSPHRCFAALTVLCGFQVLTIRMVALVGLVLSEFIMKATINCNLRSNRRCKKLVTDVSEKWAPVVWGASAAGLTGQPFTAVVCVCVCVCHWGHSWLQQSEQPWPGLALSRETSIFQMQSAFSYSTFYSWTISIVEPYRFWSVSDDNF